MFKSVWLKEAQLPSIKDDQILFLAAEHIEGRTGMIYIGQSYITEFLNQFHKNIREVLKKILAIDKI